METRPGGHFVDKPPVNEPLPTKQKKQKKKKT